MMGFNSVKAVVGFINAANLPLIILSEDSRIIFASRDVCELLGADDYSQIDGKPLARFVAKDQGFTHENAIETVPGRLDNQYGHQGVVKALTLDGHPIPVRVTGRTKFAVGADIYYGAYIHPE